MLPQNFLPANAGTAFARFIIDGLGICCFNDADPNNKFWEVAFLRRSDHFLKIKVGGDEYNISSEVKTIDIVVDNGSNTHYAQFSKGYFEGGADFHRTCAHPYDFRWVVNFLDKKEVPHGNFKELKTRGMNSDRVGVTLVRIPHSLFYTDTVTDNFVILSPQKLNGSTHGMILGATNETIGALILAENPRGLKIVVGDGSGGRACDPNSKENNNCVIDLPYEAGQILDVNLTNMDEEKRIILKDEAGVAETSPTAASSIPDRLKVKNYLEGDFHRYYEVIETDGEKLTLWAAGRDSKDLNKLGDCNLVRVEDDEVKSLASLIE
ncbi:MAG TPA: hypothetical protein VEY11_04655 [Pyrinomonadaceae bacterium]|nr:hypothetical protein [Pyrinomonadaceae bacterium]